MRRALALLVASLVFVLPGAALAPVSAASGSTALSCASPKHMAMVNGHYTTVQTIQYDTNHFVNMDAWSADPTLQQTMDVCSTGEWTATVTETSASNPRVVTYPDSEYRFTHNDGTCDWQPDWSTLTHLKSTYDMGAPSKGDWDVSPDVFFGGAGCGTFHEVMVYSATHGNVFAPAPLANFTTADGQSYDAWWNSDASYIQVRQRVQSSSGVIRWKQLFAKLGGYTVTTNALGRSVTTPILGAHARLDFIQEGVEVVSGTETASAGPLRFHLHKFKTVAN